ncbi:MAG: sigma-70 family RNA polymerase sigma factor [Ginsengibacter sp.]
MEIDKNIWKLIEDGDELAYQNMYFFYYKRFYIYGQKISPDIQLIEDSIQEIMILIWNSRARLSAIGCPSAYYYTSFRNLLINKLKFEGKFVSEEFIKDEHTSSTEISIIRTEEHLELNSRLKKAGSFLTNRQSEAIFLRFYEELSYEEVAEVMGITVKATYKIMARALHELREKYVLVFILLFQICYFLLEHPFILIPMG